MLIITNFTNFCFLSENLFQTKEKNVSEGVSLDHVSPLFVLLKSHLNSCGGWELQSSICKPLLTFLIPSDKYQLKLTSTHFINQVFDHISLNKLKYFEGFSRKSLNGVQCHSFNLSVQHTDTVILFQMLGKQL